MPASARYGFAVPSTKRISKFREDGDVALERRIGASRFSVPQCTYVPPDQTPSAIRLYDAGIGNVRAVRAGRLVKTDERNEASRGEIFSGVLTLFFECTEICVWAELPAESM